MHFFPMNTLNATETERRQALAKQWAFNHDKGRQMIGGLAFVNTVVRLKKDEMKRVSIRQILINWKSTSEGRPKLLNGDENQLKAVLIVLLWFSSNHKAEVYNRIDSLGIKLKRVIQKEDHNFLFTSNKRVYICSRQHEAWKENLSVGWNSDMAKVRHWKKMAGPSKRYKQWKKHQEDQCTFTKRHNEHLLKDRCTMKWQDFPKKVIPSTNVYATKKDAQYRSHTSQQKERPWQTLIA